MDDETAARGDSEVFDDGGARDPRDAVRRGYDRLADAYAEERSANPMEVDVVERFLDSLAPSARILDAGCGQGTPVLTRVSGSASVVGLDASRGQLQRATANAPAAVLVQGDMTGLPFREGTFDAVTACHSLIHVPVDQHRVVLEAFERVLRPGGRLLLTTGGTEWSGSNPDWLDSGTEMHWSMAGPEAARDRLQAVGFSVADEGTVENGLGDDEDATFPYFVARLEA